MIDVHSADAKRFLEKISTNMQASALAKMRYQSRLAPDFNPFDFINHDELSLSKMIAWLLNREGSHGQGAAFLLLFVERFQLAWSRRACETAWPPKLEFAIENDGRIDILLQSGNSKIVIENKPYALDQQGQLKRYFKYLDEQKLDARTIVYLTSNGNPPSDASVTREELKARLQNNELKLLSYAGDVLRWLEECKSICRADRVSVFIDQFSQFILKTFQGVDNVSDQNHLVEEILASSKNISAAMAVVVAKHAFQNKLFEKLRGELEEMMPEDWKFEWNVDSDKAQSGFQFDFSSACKVVFRIEFLKRDLGSANYGLKSKRQKDMSEAEAKAINEAMKLSPIGGKRWGATLWPWWGGGGEDAFLPLEWDWNISAAPWIAIHKGELAHSIMDAATKVRDALRSGGLIEPRATSLDLAPPIFT